MKLYIPSQDQINSDGGTCFDFRTQNGQAEKSDTQGHPQLYKKLEANLNYIRPCLKLNITARKEQKRIYSIVGTKPGILPNTDLFKFHHVFQTI